MLMNKKQQQSNGKKKATKKTAKKSTTETVVTPQMRYSSFWQMQWDRCGQNAEALASVQVPDLKQEAFRLNLFDGRKTTINKTSRGIF